MDHHYQSIRDLLRAARGRWRTVTIFRAVIRAAVAASAVVAVALVLSRWTMHAPFALAALTALAVVGALAAAAWGTRPLWHVPNDARVARFVEEKVPALDDRLVSAVDAMTSERYAGSPAVAEAMMADAARHARAVDLDAIIASSTVRRLGIRAAVAVLLLAGLMLTSFDRARQGVDAATLALFPAHVRLDVTPGNLRVKAGSPVTIEARLVGSRAPVPAELHVGDGDHARTVAMTRTADGRFVFSVDAVATSFSYRVTAGPAASPTYAVSVVRPPRVTRIDVDYTFPSGLNLPPRTEEDSGDIYAPAGTSVRLRIHTDKPAASGRMALAAGDPIPLTTDGSVLVGSLKVVDDNSYRVALSDSEGLSSPGDTEYFIRTLEDRAPEVRVLKPASDRSVTRLEEVDIEAQADDDYGIDRMELVYAVRGGKEQVAPFSIPSHATTVNSRRTLYLEDLSVQPGDLVSYYVRARDLTRGKRSSEAKSDIFFLEVRPFDQEFSLAQSNAMAGGGGNKSIDDLVTAQKEIVVATWKLERRSQNAKGAKSEQDIRSVARAEAELKSRAEQTSSTFRGSMMRDPRKRGRGRGAQPASPGEPSATTPLAEEDDMAAAAKAMQAAVTSLDALKTNDALSPEMEALNHLLKAQSDVKKRQIARQQSGAGGGQNNRNYDLSTLFDKELQRSQQTNYETPNSTEQKDDQNASLLDKVKELASRQDELVRRQQELAEQRAKLTEEELKRQLEKLTRDQLELRQRAEDLARQMNQQGSRQSGNQQSGQQAGQQAQSGQQSGQQQSGQQQAGQQTAGQPQSGGSSGMRSASEEMRNAAGELRKQDPSQASASGQRALQRLRDLERQLQANAPDQRRRAVGEMQLEARQLADSERQLASDAEKAGQGEAGKDALRRLAGEQDRLADRVRRLENGLKEAASARSERARGGSGERGDESRDKTAQAAAGDAARDLERQKLADRMQQAAEELRKSADGRTGGADRNRPGPPGGAGTEQRSDPRAAADAQQEMARSLEKLADKLAGATGSRDGESQKLSDQLARAQELRDRLNKLTNEMRQRAGSPQSPVGGQQSEGSPQSSVAGRQSGDSRQSSGRQSDGRQADGRQSGNQSSAGQSASAQKSAGSTGQTGSGRSGGNAGGNDLARLRDEYQRQLQQTRELMDELRKNDPNFNAQHGAGFTFEGQGMTLSAPGTEAFKQDFAKWEDLRRQATAALDNAQLALSQKLQAKESKDRLAAGVDDRAPAAYRRQVDDYFKAIASKKKQ